MATELTPRASLLAQQPNKQLQLILDVDGIPLIFGTKEITKLWRVGDDIIIGQLNLKVGGNIAFSEAGSAWAVGNDVIIGQAGLVIGGLTVETESKDYIRLQGTTKQLTQQIEPDKKGNTSITQMNVSLVDKNSELTRAFAPGQTVDDILFRRADLYSGFVGASHPEDSVKILSGVVSQASFGSGFVNLQIQNPEQKKRRQLFVTASTKITQNLLIGQTSIDIESSTGFFDPIDIVETYIRISDEIIKYESVTKNPDGSGTLNNLTRGQFDTIEVDHALNDELATIYRLQDNPLDLALKIMISGSNNYATTDIDSFNIITSTLIVPNSIKFCEDVANVYGVTVGSLVTVESASNPSNNVIDATIEQILKLETGESYIVINQTLTDETMSNATASFKSEFNVLSNNFGCAMSPIEVDVDQFKKIKDIFGATFPDFDFLLDDTIEAKQFINEDLFFTSGLYAIPRLGKSSVAYTLPPLSDATTKIINLENVLNPASLQIKRSINNYFYNTIVYKFNYDLIEDKFLAGEITEDNDSINRIPAGTKALTIESKGLPDNLAVRSFIKRQTQRFLQRYRFAAESISFKVNFETGFNLDVADTVIIDGSTLKLSDVNTGDRNFLPRTMEIININKNLVDGNVEITCADTNFANKGRFGVISPSSLVGINATTTELPLKNSFGTSEFATEKTKWSRFIGQKIKIHDEDFAQSETTCLVAIDETKQQTLIVSPALSFIPSENYIVNVDNYNTDNDATYNALFKDVFCFQTPRVKITGVVSNIAFDVSLLDVNKFKVGAVVEIHSPDFSNVSDELTVEDISSQTITVSGDIGFIPQVDDEIDLIGFADSGEPYRMI